MSYRSPLTPLKGLTKIRREQAAETTPQADPAPRSADAVPPSQADPDAGRKALADQIIIAGKRRRGEIADDQPTPDSAAAAILKAAARARGELP